METGEKMIMFRNRLIKVFRHMSKQAKRLGLECFRIYDHDLPEFPFCIEIYGDKLYVAEYKRRHGMTDNEHDQWMEASLHVMEEVISITKENIFLKLRQRKPGRLGQYLKSGAGTDPIANEFIVRENGLKFFINLTDYLDTGLFLDHRITRQLVREQCQGKKVLNLFAYTGSFSVYAAAGGAAEVVTADLSKTYLAWATRNLALNSFLDEKKYLFIHTDVLQYLKSAPRDHFDIVVLDPPTFSNSKRMEDFLDIQRDHASLINDTLSTCRPGAVIYFSTNSRNFELDKEKIKADRISDITKATTAFDFEKKPNRYCYCIKK